jgi:virulence-associated protein VapD
MYAIIFDIDVNSLPEEYSKTAQSDIRKFLEDSGFAWQQGNVYFGCPSVNAVICVITVQKLASKFPWITPYIKYIKMLRVEEDADLMSAII